MTAAMETILANRNEALKLLGANPQLVDPMGSYLVLKMIQPDEKSYGGIVLAPQAQEKNKPLLAEVIKTGPGQRRMMDGEFQGVGPKVGDLVIVVKNTPFEVSLHGETFWIGFEGDILGVVDQDVLASMTTAALAQKAQDEAVAKAQEIAEKGEVVETMADGEIRQKGGILIATGLPAGM
jgi:chaperonin GroES